MTRSSRNAATIDRTPMYQQLPLVRDEDKLSAVQHNVLSDHAILRCEERGIGIMEVYSTLAEPQFTWADTKNKSTVYKRGDVSVVIGQGSNTISTVIDNALEHRSSPRVPLNPMINRGTTVARATKKTGDIAGLDEAWCLMPHTEPDMRKVLITPSLAEKLLGFNDNNRPLNRRLVQQYAEEIAAGQWKLTHQGVAMDTRPQLQDGQHRLTAIMESGTTQPMFVAVGMPLENFTAIDTGRNRKFGDVLALKGFGDTFALGATARLVFLYLHRDFVSTHKVHNHQVVEIVELDEKGIMLAMNMGRQLYAEVGLTRSGGGAGYFVIRRGNNIGPVNEFFDGLVSGAGLHRDSNGSDPRLVLRRVIKNLIATKGRSNGPEHMALLIKTWNLWAEGRTDVRSISWRKTEAMPRVTRLESH